MTRFTPEILAEMHGRNKCIGRGSFAYHQKMRPPVTGLYPRPSHNAHICLIHNKLITISIKPLSPRGCILTRMPNRPRDRVVQAARDLIILRAGICIEEDVKPAVLNLVWSQFQNEASLDILNPVVIRTLVA